MALVLGAGSTHELLSAFRDMLERWRLTLLLFCFLFCPNARAEQMIQPGGIIRDLGARAAGTDPAQLRHDEPAASLPRSRLGPESKASQPGRPKLGSALGALVVTRDLELPGTRAVGFRLIPTKKAIGGDAGIPLVLRAKIGKSIGLVVGGRF